MGQLTDDAAMRLRVREALTSRFGQAVEGRKSAIDLEKMGGHASLRVYWRIHLPDDIELAVPEGPHGHTLVVMVLAGDPFATAEGPDSDTADSESDRVEGKDEAIPGDLAFVDIQRVLSEWGVSVPGIEHIDLQANVLFLEDLGDTTFEDVYRSNLEAADTTGVRTAVLGQYRQAIDILVEIQQSALDAMGGPVQADEPVEGQSADESCCWARRFDRETLRWELDHFLEWGVKARCDEPVSGDLEKAFGEQFDNLVDDLLSVPQTLVLRDYQSRNLMHKPGAEPEEPWVVIDFQDALVGPYVYDLVALLRDSYIELPPEVLEAGIGAYLAAGRAAGLPWCYDETNEDYDSASVREAFFLQTVQRKLKDAGRFVFIDREKGDSSFLKYIEPSLGYVEHALDQLDGDDQLAELVKQDG
jgi:aminoglycoside/choline kinase family phosphotransferase